MAADFLCMRVAFLVSVLVCLGFNKKISSFYCFHFGNSLFVRTEKNAVLCIGLVWAAKLYACSFSHQITCGQDRIESWTPPVQIGMTALRETFCSSCIYDWWIRISTDRWCMRINFQPMNAQVMCGLKSKNLYIDRNFFCMHTRWSIHKKLLHFDWNGYTSVTEWWIFFISIIKKHKDKR